jgi:pimeloyl-ACP methyl ester carboxylesterase
MSMLTQSRRTPGRLLICLLLLAIVSDSCKDKNRSDIPAELHKKVILSGDSTRLIFATNAANYYSPYMLERRSAKDPFVLTKLSIDEERDLFPESLSRDGNLLSMVSENLKTRAFDIYTYDLTTHVLSNITKTDDVDDSSPAFSPSDTKMAFLSDARLKLYDYTSGAVNVVPHPPGINYRNLVWCVNGSKLWLEDDSSDIWQYEVLSGKTTEIWTAPRTCYLASRMITPCRDDANCFYFLSDHASNFNQIYKYDPVGGIRLIAGSDTDKYLIQRPVADSGFYYKSSEDGKLVVKEIRDGRPISIGPKNGVSFDHILDRYNDHIFLFSDLTRPASLFWEKDGNMENIAGITSTDTMPAPRIFHNAAGMVNYVYQPRSAQKGWVAWLHGGPNEQMSPRFNTYLLQLLKAGWAVIVLNYPGSTGIGNSYEWREASPERLLSIQLQTIREDLLAIKQVFPSLNKYSIVGVSHGSIAAHAYAHLYKNEIDKLIDFSGIALYSKDQSAIPPTLYIYGEYDFSLSKRGRVRLLDEDSKTGQATRVIIPGEGHVINHRDDIIQVCSTITAFLGK